MFYKARRIRRLSTFSHASFFSVPSQDVCHHGPGISCSINSLYQHWLSAPSFCHMMSWPTLTMRFPFPQTNLECWCGDWRPDSLFAQLMLIEQCGAFQCEGHDKATARWGFMMPRLLINWRHSATCYLEPIQPSSFSCWTLRRCFSWTPAHSLPL